MLGPFGAISGTAPRHDDDIAGHRAISLPVVHYASLPQIIPNEWTRSRRKEYV
jgi:hypothetical protein